MEPELAIVIPAYKSAWLSGAVESLLRQTNREFTIYIGDDASPEPIRETLDEALESSRGFNRIIYHRFPENLGGRNLVAQWMRCIGLTRNEKWIWLFSDDDLADPGCVESFYRTLERHPGHRLYRFNTRKIDAEGKRLRDNRFPDSMSVNEFLRLKLGFHQESYVVEWIFSRRAAAEAGWFPELPHAWAADDLFWVRLAGDAGIRTIPGPVVSWRYSGANLSARRGDGLSADKMRASLSFLEELHRMDGVTDGLDPDDLTSRWFIRQLKGQRKGLRTRQELQLVRQMARLDSRVWRHWLEMRRQTNPIVQWLNRF